MLSNHSLTSLVQMLLWNLKDLLPNLVDLNCQPTTGIINGIIND